MEYILGALVGAAFGYTAYVLYERRKARKSKYVGGSSGSTNGNKTNHK